MAVPSTFTPLYTADVLSTTSVDSNITNPVAATAITNGQDGWFRVPEDTSWIELIFYGQGNGVGADFAVYTFNKDTKDYYWGSGVVEGGVSISATVSGTDGSDITSDYNIGSAVDVTVHPFLTATIDPVGFVDRPGANGSIASLMVKTYGAEYVKVNLQAGEVNGTAVNGLIRPIRNPE